MQQKDQFDNFNLESSDTLLDVLRSKSVSDIEEGFQTSNDPSYGVRI